MKTTSFSTLCLLAAALSGMTAACTADSADAASSEDGLTTHGVPEGEPLVPPAPVPVVDGTFSLSRNLDQPDPGSVTALAIAAAAGGYGGTATLTTTSTTFPAAEGEPVPTGVPGLPPPPPPPGPFLRKYNIWAQNTPCGKIYNGRAATGTDTVKIYDYRDLGPSCPALVASEIFVEETISGVTSKWYGKTSGVLPADATKLVAHTGGGGFTPPPPPGSECAIGAADYQLTIATRKIVWETCEFKSWDQPLTKARGERTLTQAEASKVLAAARSVKIATQQMCGADKPLLTITVSTPTSSVTYKDDFYSCFGAGPFVENIDAVFGAFRDVVGH
jgi:hypothetical protein